jgi:hypothetical protein
VRVGKLGERGHVLLEIWSWRLLRVGTCVTINEEGTWPSLKLTK